MNKKNQQLVIAIRSGDKQAFEELFRTYYKPLVRFAYTYVHSVPTAKDIVQESLVKMWEVRETLNPDQSIRSYIYNTVRNNALDYKRHEAVKNRNRPHLRLVKKASVEMKEEVFEDPGFIEAVQAAIQELPDRAREVYVLHRSDGFTYKEIAQIMEISVKTVESQMTRALKKLRYSLAEYQSVRNSG